MATITALRLSRPSGVRTDIVRSGTHLPTLDGLRGVAIVLVFFAHAIGLPLRSAVGVAGVVGGATRIGWTGVDLFFVLSGFLITGILLDTKGRPHWWRNFVARRVLRIFPLYYGVLVALFVVFPLVTHWSEPQYATLRQNQAWFWTYTVNFLNAFTHGAGTPLNTAHFWSLAIEEQYYLFWPLIVWRCEPRTLLRLAAGVGIGGLAFRLAVVLHDPTQAAATYVLTPGRLDALTMGGVIAVLARAPGGLGRFAGAARYALAGGIALLGALWYWRGGVEYSDPVTAVVAYPIIGAAYASILVLAILGTAPIVTHFLSATALRALGKYSYALYVFHFPVIAALDWKFGQRLGVWSIALAAAALSFGAAWLSYHTYEGPILRLKRYFEPSIHDSR